MVKKENNFAYIDGANLYKGSKELGFEVDYKKFRGWLRQKYGITRAFVFIGLIQKNAKLYQYLQESGFVLIFKETTVNADGKAKGNCDAELVLKAVSDLYEGKFWNSIIISSDGDFSCLVNFLKEKEAILSILVPHKQKCSILLKRTGVPIVPLDEHYHKFSLHEPKNEKAPDRDASL